MQRIVILGRGAAGKSTLARLLGERAGLPVIELDKHFWRADLAPTPLDEWRRVQHGLVEPLRWIMDGDLGNYDAVEVRLEAADTVFVLDYPLLLCAWRATRRSRERVDFWYWLVFWRNRSRPTLLDAIARFAPHAQLVILRSPRALRRFLSSGT